MKRKRLERQRRDRAQQCAFQRRVDPVVGVGKAVGQRIGCKESG